MSKKYYIRLANVFGNRLIQAKDNFERTVEINEIIFHFCDITEKEDGKFDKKFFREYIDMIVRTAYKI